ncbi:MAG: hypothetical protein ACUVWR_08640 [Anaerolineae bacterium]
MSVPTVVPEETAAEATPAGSGSKLQPEDTPEAEATATATRRSAPSPEVTETKSAISGPAGELAAILPGGAGGNPTLRFFPELRDSPGPDWLQEGVRVTYYVQSASIGKIFDEELGEIREKTTAGAGYAQYDLVALDGGLAISSLKFYLDTGRAIIPSLVLPSWGVPGAGDYWVDPKALERAEEAEAAAEGELTVTRMPTTIQGKEYQAVRFEYKTKGAEYVWVFDEDSGILLFYRHAIESEDEDKQWADATLVQRRQLKLPWQNGSLPNWVREGAFLGYEGTYTVEIMGSPSGSMAYAVEATVKRVGHGWSEFTVSDYLLGRLNGTGTRISGVAQITGPIWLPREALRALGERRALDRDPVTGAETSVSRGQPGTIVLTEAGAAYTTTLTYDDKDGTLLAMEERVSSEIATIIIQLQLTERR